MKIESTQPYGFVLIVGKLELHLNGKGKNAKKGTAFALICMENNLKRLKVNNFSQNCLKL